MVSCSLSRCGAACGSPSSLQHSLSLATWMYLSSAGPLSKKTERGVSSAKHFVRHPSVSSKDNTSEQGFCRSCLSDFNFFSHLISPEQTFLFSEALGSVQSVWLLNVLTSLTATLLKCLYPETVPKFFCTLMQTVKAFRCCCRLCLYHSLPHFALRTPEVATGADGFTPWLARAVAQ